MLKQDTKKKNKNKFSTQKKNLILKFINKHPDHAKSLFNSIENDCCMDCLFGKKLFHCKGCVRKNMTICNDGEGAMEEWHCYCKVEECKLCNKEYCSKCIEPCDSCNLSICKYGDDDSCTQICDSCCRYCCKNCVTEIGKNVICKSCNVISIA